MNALPSPHPEGTSAVEMEQELLGLLTRPARWRRWPWRSMPNGRRPSSVTSPSASPSPGSAPATRRRLAKRGVVLRVVGIDYLKFLKATDRYRGQRPYEVGEITSGLKAIAKEQEVCILLLAQLNRGIEAEKDKRPDLHHLRESGDIEADADVVMFLFREAHYIEKSAQFKAAEPDALAQHAAATNKLEVIIAKNRNGPTTTTHLFCDIGASAVRNAGRSCGEQH